MSAPSDPRDRRKLVYAACLGALVLLAFGLRLWPLAQPDAIDYGGVLIKGAPYSDAKNWDVMATEFSRGERLAGAWRAWDARRPFWWMFLGSIYALTGASLLVGQLVSVLLSTLSVAFAFDLSRRLAPLPVAVLVGLVQALDLTDRAYALTTMSEPLGSFLTVLGCWLCVGGLTRGSERPVAWWWLFAGGAVLALSNLARPLNLPFLGAVPIVTLFAVGRSAPGRWWLASRAAVVVLLGAALTFAPWLIRQQAVHGIVTLSDNSAVAMYAATSPEHGRYSSRIPSIKRGMTVGESFRSYTQDAKENLARHPGFYVANVWKNLQLAVSGMHYAGWALLLVIACSCMDHLRRGVLTGRMCLVHAGLGLTLWWLPGGWALHGWIVASLVSLLLASPVAVVAAVLASSILQMGMTCLVMDRFLYSLLWMEVLVTGWLLWEFARRASGRGGVSLRAQFPSAVDLGALGRRLQTAGWAALACLVLGAGCATLRGAAKAGTPAQSWEPSFLAHDEAQPWIERVLSHGSGPVYIAYEPFLQVAVSRPRSGYDRVWAPFEGNRYRSPPFTARSYGFSMHDFDPTVGSGLYWSYVPGDIRALERDAMPLEGVTLADVGRDDDWVFVGMVVVEGSERRFEVIGYVRPGDPPLLVQPNEADAVLHSADLRGASLRRGNDRKLLGTVERPAVFQLWLGQDGSPGTSAPPVLFVGDRIRWGAAGSLSVGLTTFEPTFDADRPVVNPSPPLIDGRELLFEQPGEYYLSLPDGQFAKVCVLSRDESPSQSLLRVFDFFVANTVVTSKRFEQTRDQDALLDAWMRQRGPVPMLPSDQSNVLSHVASRVLGLPTRIAHLAGVSREGDAFARASGYLVEVYLPDRGGFVLFDVANGWYAPGLDAAGCARAFVDLRERGIDLTEAALTEAGLMPPASVPRPSHPATRQLGFDDFAQGLPPDVRGGAAQPEWWRYASLLGGGVGYYGASRGKGTGTGFISESYTFGSLHTDPELDAEVARWIGEYYDDVTIVPLDELEARLAEGHAEEIAARAWEH
ncbi:MAG: hypothetical protein DRQ55_12240 [Planctomycetota bacterium]|nr:MAG: hypothetical protein DRQ55_12240 [Planctomycetota bacterium]